MVQLDLKIELDEVSHAGQTGLPCPNHASCSESGNKLGTCIGALIRGVVKCKIQIPDEAVTKQHRHPDLIIYVIFLEVSPKCGTKVSNSKKKVAIFFSKPP